MPIRFAQLSSAPARALQTYLILIGCAANQQVITYGRLAERRPSYADMVVCVFGTTGGVVPERRPPSAHLACRRRGYRRAWQWLSPTAA